MQCCVVIERSHRLPRQRRMHDSSSMTGLGFPHRAGVLNVKGNRLSKSKMRLFGGGTPGGYLPHQHVPNHQLKILNNLHVMNSEVYGMVNE